MPLPVTRPMTPTGTVFQQGTLNRPAGPAALSLPPSNGVSLPYQQGIVHTVKDPRHVVPTASKVTPAAVS